MLALVCFSFFFRLWPCRGVQHEGGGTWERFEGFIVFGELGVTSTRTFTDIFIIKVREGKERYVFMKKEILSFYSSCSMMWNNAFVWHVYLCMAREKDRNMFMSPGRGEWVGMDSFGIFCLARTDLQSSGRACLAVDKGNGRCGRRSSMFDVPFQSSTSSELSSALSPELSSALSHALSRALSPELPPELSSLLSSTHRNPSLL